MLPAVLIAAKRDGRELTEAEIRFFIDGYARERIPDYQMSAMAMAIFLQGMTTAETAALTDAMLQSGARLVWPDDGISRVDKHSTGGIGDKTSLILAPLLAECGLQVPMLSGRGLGPTGGTLDKLESVPGYRCDLSMHEIMEFTCRVGCVITGASRELAPADRRLYELRDVTGTVPSVPLITASIMSKKLAESPDHLVLDVKHGTGAFMKTCDEARCLAQSLVATGERMGVPTVALITDMNQPLGQMCGSTVEVQESLEVLRGNGPDDVRTLTLQLGAELLMSAGITADHAAAVSRLAAVLDSGAAQERFWMMAEQQSASSRTLTPAAPAHRIHALRDGTVESIQTELLGNQIIAMGGGRRRKGDRIDHSVGIRMLVRIGDAVTAGSPLLDVFCRTPATHVDPLRTAVTIGDTPTSPPELIVERIASGGDGRPPSGP